MTELLTVLAGVLAGAAVAAVGLVVATRSVRRQSAIERDAAVRSAMQSVAADRDEAVRAAVDTVLQVAGEKFTDHQHAAERELDLRNRTIAEQVAGLNQSFEQQVGGMNHAFEHQLTGMNEELRRVAGLVNDLQRDRAAQHHQVVESIRQTARQTASLSEVTQGLREALANSRARGQWGERMADDVLRAAGFVEGVNYRKQVSLPGGSRPDVTFLMPHDRLLHMDVKFPIDNYLRFLEVARERPDDPMASTHRTQFLKDVRLRVKELTTRDYMDPETTLGYVLLFIPNEAVYGFVHENDPGLVDVAMQKRVVLCSPFTLFAVLGVVRQAVESVQLQRTSDEIVRCLGRFSQQWDKFSESIDTLGKRFESAQRAYDDLSGTRRRQMQRTLDEVDRLRQARGLAVPVADRDDSSNQPPRITLGHGSEDGRPVDPDDDLDDQPVALAAVANGDPSVPAGGLAGQRVPRLRPIRGR